MRPKGPSVEALRVDAQSESLSVHLLLFKEQHRAHRTLPANMGRVDGRAFPLAEDIMARGVAGLQAFCSAKMVVYLVLIDHVLCFAFDDISFLSTRAKSLLLLLL